MRKSILIPTVLVSIVVLCVSVMPRKAEAGISDSVTDGLLIGAYTAAGVAVVTIAAILLAPKDEPDFLEFVPPARRNTDLEKRGIRFGPACRMPDGTWQKQAS